MAGIGYGKYSARQILGKLAPAAEQPAAPAEEESGIGSVVRRVFGGDHSNAIRVKGHGDLLVYRARCCNPIRGEAVVGFLSRGEGGGGRCYKISTLRILIDITPQQLYHGVGTT